MKTRILMVFGVLIVSALMACTCGKKAETTLPHAEADALWRYITVAHPYKNWSFWPGKDGIYPGQSPHGAFLKLYANDIAINAVKAGMKTMPDGAILVKENYGKDQKTLMAVTPMYKVPGYNPDAGDWFWGKYGPDGEVMAAGKPKGCIQCHTAVKESDWIFTEAE